MKFIYSLLLTFIISNNALGHIHPIYSRDDIYFEIILGSIIFLISLFVITKKMAWEFHPKLILLYQVVLSILLGLFILNRLF